MKKGEKIHIFPLIGKKYAYFFPNWLKIYKIVTKKGWHFFACSAHTLIIIKFGEKNMNQESTIIFISSSFFLMRISPRP